jgi:ABC-2 type transport system ATP-binding protein
MSDHTLDLERLSKRYGETVALDELSFEVRPGEIFGFVGSNGAGKTTAMRIVLGVLAADAGHVRFGGVPVTFETRRRIGYMPEERGLYPRMRVGEQLTYLSRLHNLTTQQAGEAVRRWTERLGIAGRVDDEVQKLSLGNQQRVQLAAALVHDPDVLVLDEPFSGLDPVAVDVMSGVLADKADEGVPIVFSSHQLDLVQRLCHRVGIVADGRMVAVGSVDELRRGGGERLVVDAPSAPDGWADAIPGVVASRREGSTTVLDLAQNGATVDDQFVLRTALQTGPVLEFVRTRPSLAERFRSVVSDSGAGEPNSNREALKTDSGESR